VPKFPEPPPRGQLAARLPPAVHVLSRGSTLWRIYYRGGTHPVAWNRFRRWGPAPNMRFDHHSPPPKLRTRSLPARPALHRAIADPALDPLVAAAAPRFNYLVVP
jgi:hypothetical protein